MAADKDASVSFAEGGIPPRYSSPQPSGLRQRPLGRAATFAESSMPLRRRRSSIFSDSLSEAHKSFRSSTDDLLFPSANSPTHDEASDHNSNWHSLPLGLALLPALVGLFVKNGSSFVTDVTLLALAAIFMNWSLRVPWEWYKNAQSFSPALEVSGSAMASIDELDEPEAMSSDQTPGLAQSRISEVPAFRQAPRAKTAQMELRVHEALALLACFLFPLLAAWLLHAIRSQLSRPSEGLVSDYNLTIFMLVAEVRPFSHLIKLIQRRTLFLQKSANVDTAHDLAQISGGFRIDDMVVRIEELEAHVANGITAQDESESRTNDTAMAKVITQACAEARKVVQPELDTLNRAMRRYEKRSTISAVQIETRLQDLESRMKDVVALAAAAQRNVEAQPKNFAFILANWASALVVVPVQSAKNALVLPSRLLSWVMKLPSRFFQSQMRPKRGKDGRSTRRVPHYPEDNQKLKKAV